MRCEGQQTIIAQAVKSETGIATKAGPLSQWLHKHLTEAGFETVLTETRQVKGALKAVPIKTDLLSPTLAAAAMSLSSVSVITNVLRLRRVKL